MAQTLRTLVALPEALTCQSHLFITAGPRDLISFLTSVDTVQTDKLNLAIN